MFKSEIMDGKTIIKKNGVEYEFYTDKARPFMIKDGFQNRHLYLLKWNSLVPAEWKLSTTVVGDKIKFVKKELVPIDEVEFREKYSKMLPEMLRTTQDTRFLKGMKKYAGGEEGGLKKIFPIIAIVFILGIVGLAMSYVMNGGKII